MPTYHSWEESNIIDDIGFEQKDADLFKSLLSGKNVKSTEEKTDADKGVLKGKIVEVTKDFVVVDVGLKSEGLIPINEFSHFPEISLDAEVEVLLDRAEDEHGQIVLSREKAERLRQWENIVENCEKGSIVKGRIVRKVKCGFMVDIGVEAFLPVLHVDNKRPKNLDDYIGQECDFKVLHINLERKNVVVSRRELLELERAAKKEELLEHIKPGDIKEGIVKNITNFGVFVDLDGIDALLHLSDMSWTRIKHPSTLVHLGQKLKVVILSVDKEKGRVALGLKQKEPNPWNQIEQKYPPGTRVEGRVVNLLPYGAFIELEPGIEGLIHNSEMSWTTPVTDPSQMVKKGDLVKAEVLSIQNVSEEQGGGKRISLGIKQLEHNPWEGVEERYQKGQIVQGKVRALTDWGAFVELERGLDGLIHISDLSWTKKIFHPSEMLKKDQAIEAVVLSVDKESKKITLGIKQRTHNPWEFIDKIAPLGKLITGKVTKVKAFGAFVELGEGIEGLIHASELSDQPLTKIEDLINEGSIVTAKVIKVEPEQRRVALSIKDYLIEKNQNNRDDIVLTSE